MSRPAKMSLMVFLFSLCVSAALLTHRMGEPTPAPQPRDLYSVVTKQLAAFRAADFSSAYHYAASDVQQKFSPPQFERMVRSQHIEMTRNARVEFGLVKIAGATATAQVFLVRDDGSARALLYSFVAEDGAWKINGVEATSALQRRTQLAGLHV